MSLTPVQPEEQIQKACQLGLTVLSSPETPIPGNLLDGIQSFKALISGIVGGQLFICQRDAPKKVDPPPPPPPAKKEETPVKETEKKKVSTKKG